MEASLLESFDDVKDLVAKAQSIDEPVMVLDEGDECLVAMRPSVFERILFDTDLLNVEGRENVRL